MLPNYEQRFDQTEQACLVGRFVQSEEEAWIPTCCDQAASTFVVGCTLERPPSTKATGLHSARCTVAVHDLSAKCRLHCIFPTRWHYDRSHVSQESRTVSFSFEELATLRAFRLLPSTLLQMLVDTFPLNGTSLYLPSRASCGDSSQSPFPTVE